jgi:hypothetical protein
VLFLFFVLIITAKIPSGFISIRPHQSVSTYRRRWTCRTTTRPPRIPRWRKRCCPSTRTTSKVSLRPGKAKSVSGSPLRLWLSSFVGARWKFFEKWERFRRDVDGKINDICIAARRVPHVRIKRNFILIRIKEGK